MLVATNLMASFTVIQIPPQNSSEDNVVPLSKFGKTFDQSYVFLFLSISLHITGPLNVPWCYLTVTSLISVLLSIPPPNPYLPNTNVPRQILHKQYGYLLGDSV